MRSVGSGAVGLQRGIKSTAHGNGETEPTVVCSWRNCFHGHLKAMVFI